MAEEGGARGSSFGLPDITLQGAASTYDASFAYLKVMNPAGVSAIDAASSAFGYTFLGAGVLIGTLQDGGWNGGIKNAVAGMSAIDGAALGAFYGELYAGPWGAAGGAIVGGLGLNAGVSWLFDQTLAIVDAGGRGDTLSPLMLELQKFQGSPLPYTQEYLQYLSQVNGGVSRGGGDSSQASVFDTGAPAAPFVLSNQSLSPENQDPFGHGVGNGQVGDGNGIGNGWSDQQNLSYGTNLNGSGSSGQIGDGNGIGNWWDVSTNFTPTNPNPWTVDAAGEVNGNIYNTGFGLPGADGSGSSFGQTALGILGDVGNYIANSIFTPAEGATLTSGASSEFADALQQSLDQINSTNQTIDSGWLDTTGSTGNSSQSGSSSNNSRNGGYSDGGGNGGYGGGGGNNGGGSGGGNNGGGGTGGYSGGGSGGGGNNGGYSGSGGYSGAGGYGGYSGGGGYGPVVLDLAGKGINIAKLTSSNAFENLSGDGYKHRTAWAGAGNAVLFFDPNNTNAITQANQVIFKDWDPTAKTDMQALLDVFDTNHDGKLDAGDADFSEFKLMVTNADGTTSVETLAQAGITSIDLSANNVTQTFSDGSSIDGETTYTTTSGATGTAATVTFAADPNGYVVQSTTTTNATTGAVTVDNKALRADGSLASETISATSSDGMTRTVEFDLNGDGQIDVVQTDDTVANATGTVETLTDTTLAGILIDSTVTITSTDPTTGVKTVTIDRDANGSVVNGVDVVSQHEVDTTSDGLTTISITDLNPDGSVKDQTVTTPSADGLTNTVQQDFNGDGIFDLTTVTATTVDAMTGARTTTVTDTNADGSERDQTITIASADGQSQTVSHDFNGDGVVDLTTVSTIVQGTTSSVETGITGTTTTIIDTAANGAFLDKSVSFQSNDGLTKVTQTDVSGGGTSAAPVFDLTTTDVTTVDATTGNRTETVTDFNSDGSLRDQSVTIKGADGITRTTELDTTGAVTSGGASVFDQIETVTVNSAGSVIDTASAYTMDGTLIDQTVTTTSADGLTKVVQADLNGDGTVDLTTTTTTAPISGGGSTVTVTDQSANGTLIDTTTETTSADGLVVTTQSNVGGNVTTTTDTTVVDPNTGTRTETVAVDCANGTLESNVVTVTSADRNTQTISSDFNGDGNFDQIETIIKQSNGSIVDTVSNYATNGALVSQLVSTSSADGLSKTTTSNVDGKVNSATTDITVLNADGSRTETITQSSNNGNQISQTVATISATGLSKTTTTNIDGKVDDTTTDVTVLNADGSRTETVTNFNSTNTKIDQTSITTSANGLSVTTLIDENGDGVIDLTKTDVTVLNADGSKTETVTTTNADGTLNQKSVTTTSATGLNITVQADTTGDGSFNQVTTQTTQANGDVVVQVQKLNQDGSLVAKTVTTTSADGLSQTTQVDLNGDGVFDQTETDVTVINADGSRTKTEADSVGSTVVGTTVTTTSADGNSQTVAVTKDGILQETDTTTQVYHADGSQTLTAVVQSGDGATQSETVTTTSLDKKTTTIQRNTFGPTPLSSTETKVIQADGSVIDTVTDFNASGTEVGKTITTTAANGLSTSATADQNGDGIVDETESDVTTIAVDGSRTETFTDVNGSLNSITGGFTKSATVVTTTSANGLSKTVTTTGTNGQGSLDHSSVQTTVLNADGSQTTTDTETVGNATDVGVTTTDRTGLTVTQQLSTLGSGTFDRTDVLTTNLNGSTTETVTNSERRRQRR